MSPAIDKLIRKGGDPILKVVCEEVQPGEYLPFLETMERVCKKAPGAGLAAPKIGVAKRVIYIADSSSADGKARFMINPEIVSFSKDSVSDFEGSLSYPGERRRIGRYSNVLVKYLTTTRVERQEWFTGYAARVVQHEIDHLNGKNITDGEESSSTIANGKKILVLDGGGRGGTDRPDGSRLLQMDGASS